MPVEYIPDFMCPVYKTLERWRGERRLLGVLSMRGWHIQNSRPEHALQIHLTELRLFLLGFKVIEVNLRIDHCDLMTCENPIDSIVRALLVAFEAFEAKKKLERDQ